MLNNENHNTFPIYQKTPNYKSYENHTAHATSNESQLNDTNSPATFTERIGARTTRTSCTVAMVTVNLLWNSMPSNTTHANDRGTPLGTSPNRSADPTAHRCSTKLLDSLRNLPEHSAPGDSCGHKERPTWGPSLRRRPELVLNLLRLPSRKNASKAANLLHCSSAKATFPTSIYHRCKLASSTPPAQLTQASRRRTGPRMTSLRCELLTQRHCSAVRAKPHSRTPFLPHTHTQNMQPVVPALAATCPRKRSSTSGRTKTHARRSIKKHIKNTLTENRNHDRGHHIHERVLRKVCPQHRMSQASESGKDRTNNLA